MFVKSTQGEGKKDCRKAACSGDAKAKDGKKRQKEATGNTSNAAHWEGVSTPGKESGCKVALIGSYSDNSNGLCRSSEQATSGLAAFCRSIHSTSVSPRRHSSQDKTSGE